MCLTLLIRKAQYIGKMLKFKYHMSNVFELRFRAKIAGCISISNWTY